MNKIKNLDYYINDLAYINQTNNNLSSGYENEKN